MKRRKTAQALAESPDCADQRGRRSKQGSDGQAKVLERGTIGKRRRRFVEQRVAGPHKTSGVPGRRVSLNMARRNRSRGHAGKPPRECNPMEFRGMANGLYVSPPKHASFCMWMRNLNPSTGPSQPMLPMRPGRPPEAIITNGPASHRCSPPSRCGRAGHRQVLRTPPRR